jgi:hypothetical protein
MMARLYEDAKILQMKFTARYFREINDTEYLVFSSHDPFLSTY